MPTERLGGAPFFRVDCHREVAGNGWDEPCKSRGLRTVLWAAGGEIPPADPAAWNPFEQRNPKKGAYPGFEGTFRSHLRNPLVELPMPAEDVMKGVDAVIVSHTHLDHWDGGEHQLVPKDIPLIVQNEADAKIIRA